MIANHICARLSALDLQIAESIPPGGNWRNVPESVPSKRLAQIRESAAAGEGSRSTYYGRLSKTGPSYTINTYYARPGNGCHLHYSQDRTLSHREAARFQSFPDSFVFEGKSQRAIATQIGNAVPPLLAFQISKHFGKAGCMIDAFCGAGGLSLGFKWNGWRSLSAVDIDHIAINTFNNNVSPVAFVGSMNDSSVIDRLLAATKTRKASEKLILLGGPPCQGFSTGGNKRSVDDERNWLHTRYAALVRELRPDLILFENVLGLLSMDNGNFLKRVMSGLSRSGYDLVLNKLNSYEFGIPQKRQRVFIIGAPKGKAIPELPKPWSKSSFVTAFDAIGDLPALKAGEDGSKLDYSTDAESDYQKLMRGVISPDRYLLSKQVDDDSDRQSKTLFQRARGA